MCMCIELLIEVLVMERKLDWIVLFVYACDEFEVELKEVSIV